MSSSILRNSRFHKARAELHLQREAERSRSGGGEAYQHKCTALLIRGSHENTFLRLLSALFYYCRARTCSFSRLLNEF